MSFRFEEYSLVADRYFYGAMFGVAWLAAVLCRRALASKRKIARPAVAGFIALLLAWSVLSFRQAQVWRNASTLFAQTLKINQRSWMAHYNLGIVEENRNNLSKALDHYQSAARLQPKHDKARANAGAVLLKLNRVPEARAAFERAIQINQHNLPAHMNLALAAEKSGDRPAAIRELRATLLVAPQFTPARKTLAALLIRSGQVKGAIDELEIVVQQAPQDAEAVMTLNQLNSLK